MQRVGRQAVGAIEAAQAVLFGIDVIELVNHGVELGDPVGRAAGIEDRLRERVSV